MSHNTTKLWLLNVAKGFQPNADLITRLSDEQQARLLNLSTSRKKQYILSRSLLAHALKHRYPELFPYLKIKDRDGLPPLVSHHSKELDVRFSISHNKQWIGVLMSTSEFHKPGNLGLDIETVTSTRQADAARYFCNDQQLNSLINVEDQHQQRQQMTRLWTQKEAYFKAFNIGILNPQLKSLTTIEPESEGFILDENLGYLHSTCLNATSEVSIFSTAPCSIDVVNLAFDGSANFVAAQTPELSWKTYGVILTAE